MTTKWTIEREDKTYIILGTAYYIILILTILFLLWDNFAYGDKDAPQTVERFRDGTVNILFFLTISGFSIFTRYIYKNTLSIQKIWWGLGFLYLASGIYWGMYYYMFTQTSQPNKTQTIIKWISMVYFILISITFTIVSCPKGCLKPFILLS
jgi:hypothetical protein